MKVTRILVAFAIVLYMVSLEYPFSPFGSGPSRRFLVREGEGFRQIGKRLKEEGIIRSYGEFVILGVLTEAVNKLKVGEYDFSRELSPRAVLAKLIQGDSLKYQVTVPEGYSFYDVAGLLEEYGLTDAQTFLAKGRDRTLLVELGIQSSSVEGYLFPDTYLLTRGLTEEHIIRLMVGRFKAIFSNQYGERARALNLSVHELVTLASLIEREAAVEEEMALISAVFHNRLKAGIKLQSDPTAVYGLASFSPPITRAHLKRESRYNTYYVEGLPAGPIANPGEKALKAALYPAKVNYLYFVAKNDGTHAFSATLAQHNSSVARYRPRKEGNGPKG